LTTVSDAMNPIRIHKEVLPTILSTSGRTVCRGWTCTVCYLPRRFC